MLPGKKYTPEDILRIIRRHLWLLLVPFAVISAATAVVARRLPDTYMSSTLIQVVPQQVSEDIVKSPVQQDIQERLASIKQLVLSRTRLERIIQEYNLYEKERQTWIMEDVVEQMRNQITVTGLQGDMFRVSYRGTQPRLVQKVTEKLASQLVEESMRVNPVIHNGRHGRIRHAVLAEMRQNKRRG